MKLNNKGYLIVEIIVASVLAMGIAYFLLELVVDLKNKNEDYYVNTLLETDKALMTREVMNDISNYRLKKVNSNNSTYVDFVFLDNITKRISIDKVEDEYIFKYGDYDSNENKYIENENYFQKKFAKELSVQGIKISNYCYVDNNYSLCSDLNEEQMKNVENGIVTISVIAKTLYSDYNYGLELNVNYNVKDMEIIVKEYNYGVDDKEYNPGDVIEWPAGSGLKWYVLLKSPATSEKVTLILANNYKQGTYGEGTDYISSNPYNIFLGDDSTSFINTYPEIKKAIDEGTLLLDSITNTHIRLAQKDELSNKVPNDSKTAFWTMTSSSNNLYLGSSNGTLLSNVFSESDLGTYDLYVNNYDKYHIFVNCKKTGSYYNCDYGSPTGGTGVSVIASANTWYTRVSSNGNPVLLSPSKSKVNVATGYMMGTACRDKTLLSYWECDENELSGERFHFVSSDCRVNGSSCKSYYDSTSSTQICYNSGGVGQMTTIYYATSKNDCHKEKNLFDTIYYAGNSNSTYIAKNPVTYYVPTGGTQNSDVGYRPVINVLKKGR